MTSKSPLVLRNAYVQYNITPLLSGYEESCVVKGRMHSLSKGPVGFLDKNLFWPVPDDHVWVWCVWGGMIE